MQADLERLTQAQAAWLLGMPARSLRDQATVPRAGDGTYDAAKLLAWARNRATATDISPADLDKLQILADWCWPSSDLGFARNRRLPGPTSRQARHGRLAAAVRCDL